MKMIKRTGTLVLALLALSGIALAQGGQNGNLAEQQKAPTVLGGTGLFNTFSTRTLCKGEFNFALFWNNFDRDPGDIDINQVPFNITVGLTDRWELWVDWVTWQQTTSRSPFLLSGYQYNAVRLFGSPFEILGPPVGGKGGSAAFFPGTEAFGGGILPRLGEFGATIGRAGSLNSPGGIDGPIVVGLGPAIDSDRASFYNDLPFFGEVDFIGFDALGRPVLGPRQSSNGSGDVYTGTKVNLIDPNHHWFSVAVGGYLKVPISHSDHARARGRTSGELEYGPILMFGQESADKRFRVYENVGYIHTNDPHKRGVKTLDLRDKLLLNGGFSVGLNKYAEFISELAYTRYVGSGALNLIENNPLDLTIGMRFFLRGGAISFGGAYRRFLNNEDDRTLLVLEKFPCDSKDSRCFIFKDRPTRFERQGDANGFVAYFSIGNRKSCPLPPAPTCVLDMNPATVNRGDRLMISAKPTTPGYAGDKVTYEYRWEVKDAQGRPVSVRGTGSSIDVPTSRLECGRYSVTATVTASVEAANCPSDCVTTGQTTCVASFEVTEPPCPVISCDLSATPSRQDLDCGERPQPIALRVTGDVGENPSFSWSTTGGSLSSTTGRDVTLDVAGDEIPEGECRTFTVMVNVASNRTRCDEPCPGASCSTTITICRRQCIQQCQPSPVCVLYFPFEGARIDNRHKACLDEIAIRLEADRQGTLVIDAHRDSSEPRGASLQRARNAYSYLVRELRPETRRVTNRVIVRNFEDACPDSSGSPEANRRVELWILPENCALDDIDRVKGCAGARPQIVTDEQLQPPRQRRRPEPSASSQDKAASTAITTEARNELPGGYAQPNAVRVKAGDDSRQARSVLSARAEILDGVIRVVIGTDGAAQFKDFTLTNPSRIVIDLSGMQGAPANKTVLVGASLVKRVRIGQPQPGVVRVVLDTNDNAPYQVMREGNSLIILVGDARLVSRLAAAGASH